MASDPAPIARNELVQIFRTRVQESMSSAGLTRSALADTARIDRSTLSQLLSPSNRRLPRADTIASLARTLAVSVDWLLGLASTPRRGADILADSMQVAPHEPSPVDENLARWHEEAAGYKIRYVPSTLPDLVKTEQVIDYEFAGQQPRTPDQALAYARSRLAYSRLPETEFEVCSSTQALRLFARGEGIWSGLSKSARAEQFERMIELTRELYPGFRFYLIDELTAPVIPYTVFGNQRAALFMGQHYFVFNTREHVRVLTSHFDNLVRVAKVHAHESSRWLENVALEEGLRRRRGPKTP